MNRGKAIAPESSIAVREFTKWTDEMDFRLLSAMLDEARLGNRVDGSWTTQAYNNMVESLRQSGLIGITKNNVKNRQKSLKDRWREVHDLFSGLSGFAWDESTKRFSTKPSTAKWRVNPIRYYDLMEELWGADRATGHMARTARQARRNITQSTFTVDLKDDVKNIPEEQPFDAGFDTAYRSPLHVDSYSPGDGTQSIPYAASTGTGGTSSSRGTKRKAPMVDVMDAQFDKLTTRLDVFMDYFGRGNDLTQRLSDIVERQVVAIERRNDLINDQINVMRRISTVQYSESDIWEMLVAMNLPDEQIMVQCYDWLCNNPSHVRRLFGLPPHLRLNQLLKLMGASMTSGSRPTRKRNSVDRKGKGTATSDEAPRRRLPSIEHVLNQTRFFSQRDQMIKYGNEFYHRIVLAPKLMDF
ncbi:hypothetical protein Fmac_029237 [Flemingia macrophylla]|uniref:Myb/SANT-like domain-containing protein n=1 Tax=Flemingia macrophylla TaxID=520843 RepID=A0ABD1LAA9_9FABA